MHGERGGDAPKGEIALPAAEAKKELADRVVGIGSKQAEIATISTYVQVSAGSMQKGSMF